MADELLLPVVLAATALGAAALVAVAVLALVRRRSLSYALVAVATGAFLLRVLLGAVTLGGYVSGHTHHVLEHALDAVVIALLFGAAYAIRRVDPRPGVDRAYRRQDD